MSPPSTSGPAGNILVVEEYDALARAIVLALKKFAPQHRATPVRNFGMAHEIALAEKPALIVIDFDPPLSGAVDFLDEMKRALPETRVLVIASGVSRENPRAGGALNFLEKPFELLAFGSAVQALLGPRKDAGVRRDRLSDLELADVIALGCIGEISAIVQVRGDFGRSGQVSFHQGQLVHATTAALEGEQALMEMLSWSQLQLSEAGRASASPRSIQQRWPELLGRFSEWAEKQQRSITAPASKPSPVLSPPRSGPRILVIDDTEMLLLFVEDSLSLADPNVQVTTVLGGLEGVRKATQLQPDLALVDYSMPDLRGDEVCRRLLAAPETSQLPVIMMSGHVQKMEEVVRGLPNVVATIGKPFVSEALVSLVLDTLEKGPLASRAPPTKPLSPDAVATVAPEKARAFSAVHISSPEVTPELSDAKQSDETTRAHPSLSPAVSDSATPPVETLEQSAPAGAPSLATAEVLLELQLDVVNMEFTPAFQIGSIRARLASPTVAIEIPALAARASLPLQTGFRLGEIDLDAEGQIGTVRLIPTHDPFHAVHINGAFDIAGVATVPANERERLELMSTAAKMTMQMFAPLTLQAIELSPALEVTQLVLSCRSHAVRVTLNSSNPSAQSGAPFITTGVQLDASRRLGELILAPTGSR